MSPGDLLLLKILAVVALVFANGFFVAAEFALVKLRDAQFEALILRGDRRARIGRRVLANLDRSLSAAQLGITLASLALGWIGEPVFAALLAPLMDWLGIESEAVRHTTSIIVGSRPSLSCTSPPAKQAPKWMAISESDAHGALGGVAAGAVWQGDVSLHLGAEPVFALDAPAGRHRDRRRGRGRPLGGGVARAGRRNLPPLRRLEARAQCGAQRPRSAAPGGARRDAAAEGSRRPGYRRESGGVPRHRGGRRATRASRSARTATSIAPSGSFTSRISLRSGPRR